VEHPMSPHTLAAPLHRHRREDEYSYVLEGRMGALLGDDLLEAGPGDLVFKPRDQWHQLRRDGSASAEPTGSRPPGRQLLRLHLDGSHLPDTDLDGAVLVGTSLRNTEIEGQMWKPTSIGPT
jgi:hypothetical protein